MDDNEIKENAYYYWLCKFQREAYDQMQLLEDTKTSKVTFAKNSHIGDLNRFSIWLLIEPKVLKDIISAILLYYILEVEHLINHLFHILTQ